MLTSCMSYKQYVSSNYAELNYQQKNNCALLTLITFNLNVTNRRLKVLICALELFEYCLLDMGEKNFKLYVW